MKTSNNNLSSVNRKNIRFWFVSNWERFQTLLVIIIFIFLASTPVYIKSPYYMGIIILATLYAYVGITWNIIAGFTGQLLMAHIIFLGVGAFTTIVLYNKFQISPWIGMFAGGIICACLGFVVSLLTLRYGLKSDYFSLFTIALMVTIKTIFLKWKLVGGAVGMWIRLSDPSAKDMIFLDKAPYLYIILTMLIIAYIIQYKIYNSKMGKYFVAIREDENAASSLGVNTAKYKTLAVVIGTALAGIGGGFYVMYVTFVSPTSIFELAINVEICVASPVIGGLGSLAGPILGAVIYKPMAELVRGLFSATRSGSSLIIYGSFLVLAILFMPRGIAGIIRSWFIRNQAHWLKKYSGGN